MKIQSNENEFNLLNVNSTGIVNTLKAPKEYHVNFENVKTIEDVILILKAMDLCFISNSGSENFKELIDKGLIIETK